MTSVPGASWIFTRDQLDRALLASRMNDRPLPPHHGSPIRLVVPGWEAPFSVKYLRHIKVVDQPYMAWNESTCDRRWFLRAAD